LDACGVARSVAHFNVQQPPAASVVHLLNEQSNNAAHAGSALHAAACALHSLSYAPVEMFVQSEQAAYGPPPLDEDELPPPDELEDEVSPDELDDDEVIPDVPDELVELDDALPVPLGVVVSSPQAPSASSAVTPTKTPHTPR